ncbi:hypothetical protein ACFX2B_014021 [Malus domestica]
MHDLAYPEEEITTLLLEEPLPEFLQMELSECAFYGTLARTTVKTMKVIGLVNGQQVTVLLDSGSTHNFVDSRLLKKFAWHTQPTKPFEVIIADGGKVSSSGCYTDAALSIGGYECGVDLYSLPLGGCDIVLGVQWLSLVSPVLWDFQLLTMEFAKNGSQYKLIHSDTHAPLIQEGTLQQLDKEIFNSNLGLFLYSIEDKMVEACELNPLQLKQLQEVLGQFDTIFVLPIELPPSRVHNHQIPLIPGSKPPNIRPYHYGPLQKTEIEKAVQELLKAGFIRPSHSPFSCPVLLVKKKEETWRMCMDYRELNAITIKDKYPIPLIDDLLDELHGARFFSKLDLQSGYHQLLMHPQDIEKTAFRTHEGHYEFLVMPFGLINAPATFQSLMNDIFRPYLRHFILVFFDDILVYSKNWEDHLLHLKMTFEVLQQHQLYVKKHKCSFGQSKVEYLGHVISSKGVKADPSKIQAIMDWPKPTTVKELRGFLGLTGYYRKFVPGFGKICQPLYHMTKNDGFLWTPAAEVAFQKLKDTMTSP